MRLNLTAVAVLSFVCCAPGLAAPFITNPSLASLNLVASNATDLQDVDGLAFDSFGNLFAVRESTGAAGGLVYVDKATGLITPLVSGIPRADQVALHTSGDLFVTSEKSGASSTNRLFRVAVTYNASNIPTSATKTSLATSPNGINNPEGLVVLDNNSAYGNAGDLYIAEDISSGRIIHVTDTGTTGILVGTSAALDRPEGMAFGDFGGSTPAALFVAETKDNNVLQIASDGTVSLVGDPTAVSLINPDNLEFGPDGLLYVSEDRGSGAGRIIQIASDGTHTVFAGGFDSPQGLAFDPFTGDLYISEQDAGKIWRVTFIPEPDSFILAAIGLAAVLGFRRYRNTP